MHTMYKIHSIRILVSICLRASCIIISLDLTTLHYEGQVDRWLGSTRLGNSKHPCMLDFPRITWYLFSALIRIQKFEISFYHL